jgi:hypothetical protein
MINKTHFISLFYLKSFNKTRSGFVVKNKGRKQWRFGKNLLKEVRINIGRYDLKGILLLNYVEIIHTLGFVDIKLGLRKNKR